MTNVLLKTKIYEKMIANKKWFFFFLNGNRKIE